ncbi:MAG: metallophosphoesterase [Anaerolineae bacterium]|jgi:predicted phosphohydrolase
MRILITADLHYRPSQREVFAAFADWVEAQRPDCLVVAGDVGHPLRLFRRALQLFAGLDCPKLLLTGNHDLYRGEFDSRTLWERVLPEATRDEGFVWLEDEVILLPLKGGGEVKKSSFSEEAGLLERRLAIVGTMGWYDYSARAPHLGMDDAALRAAKRLVNNDADFIDWPWSDVAMARYLARRFAGRLSRAADDPAVGRVLAVTHVPIFEQAAPNHPESEFWSLMRAYAGNFTLGELVLGTPKVTHVVSGHIHRAGHWTVPGSFGPIDFRLVGSQKGDPRAVVLDL